MSENIGTNVVMSVDGTKVTLTFDVGQRHGQSASGKTTIVATTKGNMDIPGHPNIKMGLNVYAK